MPSWKGYVAAAVLQILSTASGAQDRPLIEELRVGYVRMDPIGDHIRSSAVIDPALRRKGFVPIWREFGDGLAAIRSLDADEIDLALVIPLNEVVVAKRENLKMVFITELRSIAPTCCDMDELFADHMFKRYTLSSEYWADHREDVLLILHQEMIRALQLAPHRTHPASINLVRRALMQANAVAAAQSQATQIDDTAEIADVSYWLPRQR